MHFRVYLGLLSCDFPKTLYMRFDTHALHTVAVWFRSVSFEGHLEGNVPFLLSYFHWSDFPKTSYGAFCTRALLTLSVWSRSASN